MFICGLKPNVTKNGPLTYYLFTHTDSWNMTNYLFGLRSAKTDISTSNSTNQETLLSL